MRHEPAENKYDTTLTEAKDDMDSFLPDAKAQTKQEPEIMTAARELIKIANEIPSECVLDVQHVETNPDKDFIYTGVFLWKVYTHIQNLNNEIDTLKQKNKQLRNIKVKTEF